jgi:hypothetical protein
VIYPNSAQTQCLRTNFDTPFEKGHKVVCGREVVPTITVAVPEMERAGHRVALFLVPGDTGII